MACLSATDLSLKQGHHADGGIHGLVRRINASGTPRVGMVNLKFGRRRNRINLYVYGLIASTIHW
jgi:hypothetical protein